MASRQPKTKRKGETANIMKDLKKYQSFVKNETVYSLCIPGSNGLFGPNRLIQDMNRIRNRETERDNVFMQSIQHIKYPHKLNLIETEARSRSSWQYEIYRLFRKRGYTELIDPDYYGVYKGFTGNTPLSALDRYKYILDKVKSLPPNSNVVAISTSQGGAILLKCLEDPEFCTRIKCVSFVSPAYTDRLGGSKLLKDGSTLLDLTRITNNITNNGILSILFNTQYGYAGDNSIELRDREILESVSLNKRFCTTDHSFTSTSNENINAVVKSVNKNKIMTLMKILDVMYTNWLTTHEYNIKLFKYIDYIYDYFNMKCDKSYRPHLLTQAISEDDYFKDKSQSSEISENDSDVNISDLRKNLADYKRNKSASTKPNKSASSRPNKSASSKPSKSAAVKKESSPCTQFHGQPIKCNSYSKDDVHCYYTAATVKGKIGLCKKGAKYNIESSRRNSRTNKLLRGQFESSAASTIQKAFKNKQLRKIPEKSSRHSRTASTQNKSDRESRSETPSEVNRNKWMLRKQRMDIRKAHSERLDQEIEKAQRRVTELEEGSKKKKLLKSSSKKKKKSKKSKKKSK